MLYLSYIDLTPGLENLFSNTSHQALISFLRANFNNWTGFFQKYPDHSLGLIIVTKKGVNELSIKGPSISSKSKLVDYSIFLPEDIRNMNDYLDNVFMGLKTILKNYKVDESETFKKDMQALYKELLTLGGSDIKMI